MNSYIEKQPWGQTLFDIEEGSLVSITTKRAKCDLITNPYFGRILFIDNVLQSSRADEEIYHKAITVYSSTNVLERVLILGAAEGATAREVFKLARGVGSLKEVVQVDWDGELIEQMKKETWHQGAYEDPRLVVHVDDAEEYLRVKDTTLYDFVIIDLLDPHGEEETVWLLQIITSSLARVRPGGELAVQVGGNKETKNRYVESLRVSYPKHAISERKIFVPSFQDPWYLLNLLDQSQ